MGSHGVLSRYVGIIRFILYKSPFGEYGSWADRSKTRCIKVSEK